MSSKSSNSCIISAQFNNCFLAFCSTTKANPTAPTCEATEKFFDDSFPNCTQRQNPAFVEMKKCFVKFVGNAAQLNCDATGATTTTPAATDAATEAPAAAAPVSGGTRHLLATVTAARELQGAATPPPTPPTTPTAPGTGAVYQGPTPVERAFLQQCGEQIQGCGSAPECRACVTNAVKVSSLCFHCTLLFTCKRLHEMFILFAQLALT
jgi:hypothetical protein